MLNTHSGAHDSSLSLERRYAAVWGIHTDLSVREPNGSLKPAGRSVRR